MWWGRDAPPQSCRVTPGLRNVLFVTVLWCGGGQPRGGAEKPEKVAGPDSWLCLDLLLASAGREKDRRPQTQVVTAERVVDVSWGRHRLGISLLHTKRLAWEHSLSHAGAAAPTRHQEQPLILPPLGSSQHQCGQVLLHLLLATGKHLSLPGLSDGQTQVTPQQVPLLVPRGRKICGAKPKASCMGKSPYPHNSWLLALAAGVVHVFPGKLLPSVCEAAHSCVRDGWKRFGVQD